MHENVYYTLDSIQQIQKVIMKEEGTPHRGDARTYRIPPGITEVSTSEAPTVFSKVPAKQSRRGLERCALSVSFCSRSAARILTRRCPCRDNSKQGIPVSAHRALQEKPKCWLTDDPRMTQIVTSPPSPTICYVHLLFRLDSVSKTKQRGHS